MPYDIRKMMNRIIDTIMPNNCRSELKRAAEQNAVTCLDVICLLQKHNEKIAGDSHDGETYAA